MTIYLVQHGQCFDKTTDPYRSLSPKGRETLTKVANIASDAGIKVSAIYHSGKLRAQQSAELFYEPLKASQIGAITGIDPLDNVEDFVNQFQLFDNLMIVGHLPFMERLTSYLLTGNQEPALVRFQNAGIVCLAQNEDKHWVIKWTIMPVLD